MNVKVIILGSAGGLPTPDRSLPAILIDYNGELVLMDCGEGAQRQIMKAGYSLCRRMKVLITHLHGDHVFGLPGMIQSMNLLNRIHPLEVYGPKGLKEFINKVVEIAKCEPKFELIVREISEGDVLSSRHIKINGILTEHSRENLAYSIIIGSSLGKFIPEKAKELGVPEGPLWGILKSGKAITLENGRIIEPKEVLGEPIPGIKIVYTGDTRYCERLIDFAKEADLLIHEATFASDLAERAYEEGHSTAEDAAKIAKAAGVKKLIMTHISSRYRDSKILEEEARKIFENSEFAEDLKTYDLKS
ncbi:MAG: ribonuclease Z [Candidatus Methanomethyliaceae archaeon]|nr:ribonuclease Z [Candidatus Methanomethyliaceae archaeon]